MRFELKHFNELSLGELYDIMALRQRVFVVEQNCPFVDCDGLDQNAWHLVYLAANGNIAAYCRLLPLGLPYPGFASIGRVISDPAYRGEGHGKALMTEAVRQCRQLFGDTPLKIGAQLYLKRFYESYGFKATDDTYLEDGIEHIKMVTCL